MKPIKYRAIFDGVIEHNMSLEGMFAHYENGSCKLEQFTTLSDKDGNDIYAGDILKYPDGFLQVVEWQCGAWNVVLSHFNSEIIGNIHENPELKENNQ